MGSEGLPRSGSDCTPSCTITHSTGTRDCLISITYFVEITWSGILSSPNNLYLLGILTLFTDHLSASAESIAGIEPPATESFVPAMRELG